VTAAWVAGSQEYRYLRARLENTMAMTLGLLEANARWLLRFHAVTTGRWGPADLDIQQERYYHTLQLHVLYQPPKLPIGKTNRDKV